MKMHRLGNGAVVAFATALALVFGQAVTAQPQLPVSGHVRSADGVEIAYVDQGDGAVSIVFIHGGLADRSFWAKQFVGLPATYRLVALDLAGHGSSGRGRTVMSIAAWAGDVRAVVEALDLHRVVLVGNSVGGPVALEAAALLKGRVIGVIGVDTLHDAHQKMPKEVAHQQAEAYRKDPAGACRGMVAQLFHPGSETELHAWVEKRACAMPPEIAIAMLESFGGYDVEPAFRSAGVPIRAINGDLWPTLVEANRKVTPDFDATIMKGAGHYPMLERPTEFNRLLVKYVEAFGRPAPK